MPETIQSGTLGIGEKDRWCGYCGNMKHSSLTMFLAHLKDCELAMSQWHGRQKDKPGKETI